MSLSRLGENRHFEKNIEAPAPEKAYDRGPKAASNGSQEVGMVPRTAFSIVVLMAGFFVQTLAAQEPSLGIKAGQAVSELEKAAQRNVETSAETLEEASRKLEKTTRDTLGQLSLETEKVIQEIQKSMADLMEIVAEEYRKFQETLEKNRQQK